MSAASAAVFAAAAAAVVKLAQPHSEVGEAIHYAFCRFHPPRKARRVRTIGVGANGPYAYSEGPIVRTNTRTQIWRIEFEGGTEGKRAAAPLR